MKVTLCKYFNKKEDCHDFGIKILFSPKHVVFVSYGKELYSTTDKEKALLKLKEVETIMNSDEETVNYLMDNPNIKVLML